MTTEALPKKPKSPVRTDIANIKNLINRVWPHLRDFFLHAIGQIRVLKKSYPGIMHLMIFWGVSIQIFGTAINLMQMQLFIPFVELDFPRGSAYIAYELVMDLAGGAILIGVLMAAFRRVILRPGSLDSNWDDYYALIILALIPIVGFTTEGLRLVSSAPTWSNWSPIGNTVAGLMRSLGITSGIATQAHTYFFWTHAVLGLVFLASIPFTKLRHLIAAPLNVILRDRRREGALHKIENIEEAEILGAGKISDFRSIQLLSFDACLRCGRCEEVCPAAISGMPYSPKDLIQTLRGTMVATFVNPNGNGDQTQELIGSVIPEGMPWSCTTCGACMSRCPAFVNPVDEIIDLRRHQVLMTGQMPKTVGETLRNMERQGNPWGMPGEDRISWADGLDVRVLSPGEEVDVLLFLGCAFAYDERNKRVTKSFIHILQNLGVDFGVLGVNEMCCGETARRLGHEYLFQVFAQENIETFSGLKFNRIVTQCAHCFNTLKNEYPQMGGDYEIQHYTEFLAELTLDDILDGKKLNGSSGRVTYHDSCYLGRYNDIYNAPRHLLAQVGEEVMEMSRGRENAFCCGGGGGGMWMETDPNTRINHQRLNDAIELQADVLTTACPYCLLMFDDAIRSKGLGEDIQVMDIAEVLEKHLDAE